MPGSVRKLVAVVAVGLLAAAQLVSSAQAAGNPGIVFSSPVAADGITAWPGDADKTPEHAASTAPTLWRGDSLQFAISDGLPGENATSTEIGAALLPTGPAVYTFAPTTGATPGAAADITRAGSVTSYRIEVPWTALGFTAQPTGPIAISLALNENDGAGRAGAMQWASGIVTGKTTTLYLPGTFTG